MAITDPARRPAPFMLWSWAMLFVVLLSAAPTGGAPRTQLIGSAFDPATVSVALSPKQPKAQAAVQAPGGRLPKDHAGPPPALAIIELAALPAGLVSADHSRIASPVGAVFRSRRLVRAHGARAPPPA